MSLTFNEFGALVRERRTSMLVHPDREVPTDLVRQLCDLAQWAPCHKRTWPTRFAVFTGQGRARLGRAFHDDMVDRDYGDQGKRDKTLTKYLRTPAALVIGCAEAPTPSLHDDNRDAVAAGIQNLALGATALGLATYWGTAPLIDSQRVLQLCGFEPNTRIITVMYLGWASGSPEAPPRPEIHLNEITE